MQYSKRTSVVPAHHDLHRLLSGVSACSKTSLLFKVLEVELSALTRQFIPDSFHQSDFFLEFPAPYVDEAIDHSRQLRVVGPTGAEEVMQRRLLAQFFGSSSFREVCPNRKNGECARCYSFEDTVFGVKIIRSPYRLNSHLYSTVETLLLPFVQNPSFRAHRCVALLVFIDVVKHRSVLNQCPSSVSVRIRFRRAGACVCVCARTCQSK